MRGMPKESGDTPLSWMRWMLRWPGIALAFLWGLAEGTLFFVVPDVLLSLVAMFDARRAVKHIAAATAGAVIAGAMMFSWSTSAPMQARAAVLAVPFVRPAMFNTVGEGYLREGIRTVFKGPALGIPYKIYAIEAPRYVKKLSFLMASVPARAWRFIVVWLLFAAGGSGFRKRMPGRPPALVGVHAVAWIAFYAYYWATV